MLLKGIINYTGQRIPFHCALMLSVYAFTGSPHIQDCKPITGRLEVEYIEKYSIQYRLLSHLMNTILNTFFKKVFAYITEYIVNIRIQY